MKTKLKCEMCGKSLSGKKIIWLELSLTDSQWYKRIPKKPISQGFFPFGSVCAKK